MMNKIVKSVLIIFLVTLFFAACPAEFFHPEETVVTSELVYIQGGTFTMGSPSNESERWDNEGPQHQVTVSSFYMGKYEVTQAEYKSIMRTNPSYFTGSNFPVEQVSWYDAVEYCNRLSQQEGLSQYYTINKNQTDPNNTNSNDTLKWTITINSNTNGYRLPTEAEWEYACRAGTTTAYNTGNTISNNTGWYGDNSNSTTYPVGQKTPNAWGLYDMHGNVFEWCWDWGGDYSSGVQIDPRGPTSGSYRVIRGGCWVNYGQYLRSANRGSENPFIRNGYVGFRLVRPILINNPVPDIAVTFSSLSADGSSSQTTTHLTLQFSAAISGLSASDITLSGVDGVTKGTLSGSNPYTLGISGFTAGGSLSVSVAKTGYTVSGSPKTATIYYYDPPVDATPVTLAEYLTSLPGNNISFPHTVRLKVSDYSEFSIIKTALNGASNKYIKLDLTGSTVTSIGNEAFAYCYNLASVTIPASVTSIGKYAFYDCSSLVSVTIPASVTSIGIEAFSGCSSLNSITIPSSVTSIGGGAFSSCSGLTAINVDSGNKSYTSEDGVLYNKNKTVLHTYLIGKTSTYFTIPSSVTSIELFAFWDCDSLASVTIPASVTSIGEAAFGACSSLANVIIPNGVTSIERGTFFHCGSLASVTIPNGVTSIGSIAFSDCTSLASVTIPSSVTSIGDSAFYACNSLASITIPSSVTSIGDSVFLYCNNLKTINVDSGNTHYSSENGVLYNKNKTSLHIYPTGKTETSFTIPSNVTSIGEGAFAHCTSLASVTIPSSVTSIGGSAFEDCISLASVTFQGTIPLSGFNQDAFGKNGDFRYVGDIRDKFYATDPVNGTPGTYTRPSGSLTWTRQ